MKNLKILYPLNYLILQNEQGKYAVLRRDWKIVISLAGTSCFFFFVLGINFFGNEGIINSLESLSTTLIGFYITALGVIATFGGENLSLDKKIPHNLGPIYFKFASGKRIQFTRRQYICIMFGYLSFQSITFSIVSLLAVHSSANIVNCLHYYNMDILLHLRIIVVFFLFAMFSHMIITTFLGIYYLSYRIYDKEPRIIGYDVKENS